MGQLWLTAQLSLPGPDASPPASSGHNIVPAAHPRSLPAPFQTPWCRGGQASSGHICSGLQEKEERVREERRGVGEVLDYWKSQLIPSSFPIILNVILSLLAVALPQQNTINTQITHHLYYTYQASLSEFLRISQCHREPAFKLKSEYKMADMWLKQYISRYS